MIGDMEHVKAENDDVETLKTLEYIDAAAEHFGRYTARRVGEAVNKKSGYRYLPTLDPADKFGVSYVSNEKKFADLVRQFVEFVDDAYCLHMGRDM